MNIKVTLSIATTKHMAALNVQHSSIARFRFETHDLDLNNNYLSLEIFEAAFFGVESRDCLDRSGGKLNYWSAPLEINRLHRPLMLVVPPFSLSSFYAWQDRLNNCCWCTKIDSHYVLAFPQSHSRAFFHWMSVRKQWPLH